MQDMTQAGLMRSQELKQALAQLTAIDASDGAFLSCYLDARKGKAACQCFLEQKAAVIRQALSGHARLDFENALVALQRQLETRWDDEAQGLAMFSRGVAGGRFMSVMRFAAPFENSLVLYRVPEVLPLIELLQREPEFTLVLSQSDQVQVLDIDLGVARPRAWVNQTAMPSSVPDTSGSGGRVAASAARGRPKLVDRFLRLFRRSTVASPLPLLLAGDESTLARVVDWLPQRAISRLLGTVAVARGCDQREAVAFVRRRLAGIHAEASKRLVTQLVPALRQRGSAVLGHIASLEALRRGTVDTLVIADRGRLDVGANWDAKIELSRQALRQGARVLLADTAGLRRLGGVACLLRPGTPARAATLPALSGQLELVA